MGWKGKVAGKLGNLLYDSLEVPLKIYNYAGRATSAPEHEVGSQDQNQAVRPHAIEITEEKEEFGPDTSSLTAFLLSLLSSSDTGHPTPDYVDNFETAKESRNDLGGASTSEGWGVHNQRHADDLFGTDVSSESSQSISSGWKDDSRYSYETDQDSRLLVPRHGDDELINLQEAPTHSPRLPAMSEDSVLLSDDFKAFLYTALPNLVKGRLWVLLYSTARHGISLHTLYRRSTSLPGPFLLVAGDFRGAVFGGLVTATLKPASKRKYNGTNEMFVFTNVHGNPRLFRATGANRYYCLCTNHALALGGGGHFALHLDEDLLNGSSGPCDTYGSTCLANTEDFSIANVEVWGFAHTSRYAALLREDRQ